MLNRDKSREKKAISAIKSFSKRIEFPLQRILITGSPFKKWNTLCPRFVYTPCNRERFFPLSMEMIFPHQNHQRKCTLHTIQISYKVLQNEFILLIFCCCCCYYNMADRSNYIKRIIIIHLLSLSIAA